jgi:hypothetical protein
VAENVTEVPAQTGFEEALMATLTAFSGLTVSVAAVEVTVLQPPVTVHLYWYPVMLRLAVTARVALVAPLIVHHEVPLLVLFCHW